MYYVKYLNNYKAKYSKMNYIELIRNFWRSHEEHSFTPTDIALYFYLVEVCNNCCWKNPFKRNNAKILADLGIKDRRTLDSSRNRLKQAKLLEFSKNTTNPNVIYSLTSTFNAQASVQADVQVSVQVPAQVSVQADDTKDKLNYNKEKNSIVDATASTPTPKSLEFKIAEREKRETEFYQTLIPFLEIYPKELIRKFYEYWKEPNKSKTKMRFELEKTWDLSRRLTTWQSNDDKWEKPKSNELSQTTTTIDARIASKLST